MIYNNPHSHPLVGHRVYVLDTSYYGNRYSGQSGIIRAVYNNNQIAVELDGEFNNRSVHGYFYFKDSVLEIRNTPQENTAQTAEKGERTMPKFTNYLNVAVIQFLNDNRTFHTIECANYEPDLTQGDLCVVATASHGLGLAEVVEIKNTPDTPDAELRREIVAKVPTANYDSRVETRKKAAELKAKMQERAKKLQDLVLYQTLAKEDPEMAQLLAEFKGLDM